MSASRNLKRKISVATNGETSDESKMKKAKKSSTSPSSNEETCKKCTKNRLSLKCAGPYVLGPSLGRSPVKSIVQCLARKMSTDNFFTIKLLTLTNSKESMNDVKQGKMLIHTEYSLLSLLHKQEGVIHTHGLFQDEVIPEDTTDKVSTSEEQTSRNKCRRLCLVLDCLEPHNYCQSTQDFENLQSYVIKEKKLCERKALVVFLDIIKVVKGLHEVKFRFSLQAHWRHFDMRGAAK